MSEPPKARDREVPMAQRGPYARSTDSLPIVNGTISEPQGPGPIAYRAFTRLNLMINVFISTS